MFPMPALLLWLADPIDGHFDIADMLTANSAQDLGHVELAVAHLSDGPSRKFIDLVP
jgi:hypothetical protein